MNFPISGPIAPESNPPINPQFYEPSRFEVSDITKGMVTTIETTDPYNYVLGQTVRISVPPAWGMPEINQMESVVVGLLSADEFSINIDSRFFTPFNPAPAHPTATPPQVTAIGDINSGSANPNGRNQPTSIPGSFTNISPA